MLESENIDPNKLRFQGFRDWVRIQHGLTQKKLDEISLDRYSELMSEYQKWLDAERAKPQPQKRFHRDPDKPPPSFSLVQKRKKPRVPRTFND